MSKINKNVENGFLFVLGTSFKLLLKDWYNYYYYYKYTPQTNSATSPADDNLLRKIKKNRVYRQLRLSPDNNYAAYTTNDIGQYKVWLYDVNTKKAKWIMKLEHRLD